MQRRSRNIVVGLGELICWKDERTTEGIGAQGCIYEVKNEGNIINIVKCNEI